MDLPRGFDPASGKFAGVSSPAIQSNHNNTYASFSLDSVSSGGGVSYRPSMWARINNAIMNFGNWIDDIIEPVSGWISLIAMIIGAIGLLIWVFSDGDIIYIILRFIGACIIGYILLIGLGIALFLISLIMKVVRFIFWNVWTLLITLAIVGGIWAYSAYGSSYTPSSAIQKEVTVPTYEKYRCTAKVLNIRLQPNKWGAIIGKLTKGQVVEVMDIEDGFAVIEYNGQRAYASLQYLKKVD